MKSKKIRSTYVGWLLVFGLMMIGILFSQQDVVAKSKPKVKTITITKINQKTAKQVHKQLMRGKKFKLRTKGNLKTFHKKAEKLMDKVAKCTEYRFDFYPIILNETPTSTVGRYTYCTIPSRECQEYIYGIKFAKQRHKLFMNYIDKAIPELENIRNHAASDDQKTQVLLYIGLTTKVTISGGEKVPKENVPAKLDEIIASLRELSGYLHRTKFYKLSEAMKARIMLPIGTNKWGKFAMRYTLDGSRTTFKALHESKAYGKCADFASATCKICAMFDIGDCDYFRSTSENHAVARVKVRTLNRNTKYSVISNGDLMNYNDYVGYKSVSTRYRRPHKMDKKIKKIDAEKRELKMPYVRITMREASTGAQMTKKGGLIHYYIPRSEW